MYIQSSVNEQKKGMIASIRRRSAIVGFNEWRKVREGKVSAGFFSSFIDTRAQSKGMRQRSLAIKGKRIGER
jgi:hypothetical protein